MPPSTTFSTPLSSSSPSLQHLPPPTATPPSPFSPPSSILIIGSGVFGLTTAWALARRPAFSQCSITVVDRSDSSSVGSSGSSGVFPARDAASIDTSRIVRADYADAAYAALGAEAQLQWRKQAHPTDLGAQGRYSECGLVLVADGAVPASPPPVANGALPPPPGTPPVDVVVVDKSKLTGMDYARYSWANVLALVSRDPELAGLIRELPDAAAIRDAVNTGGGGSGSWGYINEGSGWADAAASMAWLYDQVRQTGRVAFVAGTVASLEHDDRSATVAGAKLSDGRVLSAELVFLAAGAWTGSLLDTSGRATATGQVLGYMDLTEDEQERLGGMPVLLNLSSGLFVIPPRDRVLKVARHAYGYLNPVAVATALPSSPPPSPLVQQKLGVAAATHTTATTITTSYPLTQASDASLWIPAEGERDLRRALHEMVPLAGLRDRPFSKTRICWYSDTPTGDFIIDYHPEWKGLFVATGDSGHAFKFMPVIGEKIADCIMRNCPPEFKGKWDWRRINNDGQQPTTWDSVVTEDGSRGGERGLLLADELAKS